MKNQYLKQFYYQLLTSYTVSGFYQILDRPNAYELVTSAAYTFWASEFGFRLWSAPK